MEKSENKPNLTIHIFRHVYFVYSVQDWITHGMRNTYWYCSDLCRETVSITTDELCFVQQERESSVDI